MFDKEHELVKAREIVAECLNKMDMGGLYVRVNWAPRFTRKMGLATTNWHTGEASIRLSLPLWPRATPEERRQTVIHEAAHVIANLKHSKQCGHGRLWKAVMMKLGAPPTRCHNVNNKGLSGLNKRYSLPCPGGCGTVHSITQNLLTRWLKRNQARSCRNCNSRIYASYVREKIKTS